VQVLLVEGRLGDVVIQELPPLPEHVGHRQVAGPVAGLVGHGVGDRAGRRTPRAGGLAEAVEVVVG
jgi:hypothetical protein